MNNVRLLKKGFYDHHQGYNFIYVRQFMFTEQDSQKYLHLRFFNESTVNITALEMILTQINSKGKVIAKNRIKLEDMNSEPDKMYASTKALPIEAACVDFTVKILCVYSSEYQYTFRGGKAVEHYDPRGYNPESDWAVRVSNVEKQSIYEGSGKKYRLITVISLLLVASACAISILYDMGILRNFL